MVFGCFLSFFDLIVSMFSASCDVLILSRWLRVLDFVYFVVLCMVENGMCVFLVIAGMHFAWRVRLRRTCVWSFSFFLFLLILSGKYEWKTGFIILIERFFCWGAMF